MREAGVPPLVVEPAQEQEKAVIRDSLAELSLKLAASHRTAAEAYLSQGLYDESLPHLVTAATFSPSENEYHMQLGFVQYVTGDDASAIKSFNLVISDDENNGEAWFNVGMVVFGQEQYTEAEYCFRRANELEADDAQTWNNRGVCLWKLERIDEARDQAGVDDGPVAERHVHRVAVRRPAQRAVALGRCDGFGAHPGVHGDVRFVVHGRGVDVIGHGLLVGRRYRPAVAHVAPGDGGVEDGHLVGLTIGQAVDFVAAALQWPEAETLHLFAITLDGSHISRRLALTGKGRTIGDILLAAIPALQRLARVEKLRGVFKCVHFAFLW